MYSYGFELEGFYRNSEITVPPENYPHDGFPGLLEFRSTGHGDLSRQYFDMLDQFTKPNINFNYCDFNTCVWTFTPEQKRELRNRNHGKTPATIRNIYGYKPKALGNKTIASFQINISELTHKAYTDNTGKHHHDEFGLLDVPFIIKSLDEEFSAEIKKAGRQKGEYCIKSERLEYRSLPNFVAKFTIPEIDQLLMRINRALQSKEG